jgi:diacylglycerol O-acyltransferase / wax synthase
MNVLSGVDGLFLHLETPETPMHVASLHLFDLPAGYEGDFTADVRRQLRRRLPLAPVFTRKLATMVLQFANPVWIEADQVDLDYHVQQVVLPSPGNPAQLEDSVGQLHAQLLDRSRPLWRLYVIVGLQSGQVGYYIKVHHAAVDGLAGVLLAQALFDLSPAPRRIARHAALPAEHPGRAALAAAALRHDAGQVVKLLRQLPDLLKTLAGLLGGPARHAASLAGGPSRNLALCPRTPINGPITGDRGFAGVSVPLATLRALAAAHDAKLNDIVLALCSGALRRYLAQHGGIPKKPLIATMPISLRDPGNTEFRTQATLSLVNLNTQIADPVRRLRAIRDAAGTVKGLAQRARGVIPTDFPSIGTPWLLRGLATLYGRSGVAGALPPIANLVISNVPGPAVPLYAAGARMATYWPLSIVEHGVGLNITVMSYAGAMGFGFTTARTAVPDPAELRTALLAALDELVLRSSPFASPFAQQKPARRPRAASGSAAATARTRMQSGR